MGINSYLVFIHTTGNRSAEMKMLSFKFVKEAYTPFTTLNASFVVTDRTDPGTVTEVMLYVNGRQIHYGFIDELSVTEKNGIKTASLVSRSFSCMLTQNQMEPGLYTGMSLNRLMDEILSIPHVTHEDSDTNGYIYINYGSTLWEAIIAFTYKLSGRYPYIRGTNCVMMNEVSQPEVFIIGSDRLLTSGSGISEKQLLSDLHMEDINGDFGTFDLNDPLVTARSIVRHRWIELDKQFLYAPQQALEFRDRAASKGWRSSFCTSCGYSGEDISDIVSFGDVQPARITGVTVTGGRNGIFTRLSVYNDRFYSYS